MILTETVLKKFNPKTSEAAFMTVFCGNTFWPEVVNDVISGVVVDQLSELFYGTSMAKVISARMQ